MLIEIKIYDFAMINSRTKNPTSVHILANQTNFMWQALFAATLHLVVNESGNVIRKWFVADSFRARSIG